MHSVTCTPLVCYCHKEQATPPHRPPSTQNSSAESLPPSVMLSGGDWVYVKEARESSPATSTMCDCRKYNLRTKIRFPHQTRNLEHPSLQNCEKFMFVVYKVPNLWYFVIAAKEDYDRSQTGNEPNTVCPREQAYRREQERLSGPLTPECSDAGAGESTSLGTQFPVRALKWPGSMSSTPKGPQTKQE